jgi:hypothetical protein
MSAQRAIIRSACLPSFDLYNPLDRKTRLAGSVGVGRCGTQRDSSSHLVSEIVAASRCRAQAIRRGYAHGEKFSEQYWRYSPSTFPRSSAGWKWT